MSSQKDRLARVLECMLDRLDSIETKLDAQASSQEAIYAKVSTIDACIKVAIDTRAEVDTIRGRIIELADYEGRERKALEQRLIDRIEAQAAQ